MTQTVPAALVAPSKPSLTVGYLIRALNGTVATAFTTTNVTEQGTATGYYRVTSGVAAPDAGGLLEWYVDNAGSAGAFLSAATIEAMPDNFTAMAITAGGAVTAGTVSDKTGYSLSSTQSFNLTGNITGNLSGSVGSVTGAVGSVTSPVTAGTVSDKTGYSLSSTQSFNLTGNITGNLSGSVGSVTGAVGSVTSAVTVGTNNDKAGYSLTQAFPTNFSNLAITASTGQVTVGSIANNAITAAAIATDAIGSDELAASAVTEIQSGLLLAANYTAPDNAGIAALPSAATIADAVWDETLSGHLAAGSTGAKLNLASTLTVGDIPAGLSPQQVWEYATRTLSVASGLTNTQETKLNELYRKAGLDSAAPVTRTLNVATGSVAETFTGATINHVESQDATVVTSTRQ